MKKTLVTILAVCSLAAEASVETISDTLTMTTTFSDKTASAITATTNALVGTKATTLSTQVATDPYGNIETQYSVYKMSGTVGSTKTYMTPEGNVGTGETWVSTFTYDTSNWESFTLSTIALDMVAYNSNGNWQSHSTNRGLKFDVAVYSVVGQTDTKIGSAVFVRDGSYSYSSVYTFSPISFVAEEGQSLSDITSDSVKLVITASNNGTRNGCYYGLESITLTGAATAAVAIPEPATATLSLLALAGLAARRRRK